MQSQNIIIFVIYHIAHTIDILKIIIYVKFDDVTKKAFYQVSKLIFLSLMGNCLQARAAVGSRSAAAYNRHGPT